MFSSQNVRGAVDCRDAQNWRFLGVAVTVAMAAVAAAAVAVAFVPSPGTFP